MRVDRAVIMLRREDMRFIVRDALPGDVCAKSSVQTVTVTNSLSRFPGPLVSKCLYTSVALQLLAWTQI
jgi:hypothetical protein